jgi:putative glutamine amidotransferase
MSPETHSKPRVGIPWRTRAEERQRKLDPLDDYFEAVRRAGGDPEVISLGLPEAELQAQAAAFDAFLLPGSPADVAPARYHRERHALAKMVDDDRDRTDLTLLDHALAHHKPVLAVCYGCQILNVHQGGTLVQDIAAERLGSAEHGKSDLAQNRSAKDLEHQVTLNEGSRLHRLAGALRVQINSSHHQSIDLPGRDLRVTARAPDGIIEGVELALATQWVIGVQWHPERMADDRFAQSLFGDFVTAAKKLRQESAVET